MYICKKAMRLSLGGRPATTRGTEAQVLRFNNTRAGSGHQQMKQVLGAANGKGRYVRVFGGNSAAGPSVPLGAKDPSAIAAFFFLLLFATWGGKKAQAGPE